MNGWDGEYVELGAMSNFSFLEGASHPGDLMTQAKALGLAAVGVADRNTLAGMVRALMAAEKVDIRLIIGARLGFTDGTELIVFPRDRAAYGRLCRLLSLGKSEAVPQPGADPDGERIEKAETRLTFEQALGLGEGMIALTPAPAYSTPTGFARLVTYDATLSGWPTPLVDRPLNGDSAKTVDADGAHASQLTLAISALEALDAGGTAPNTTAVLEAGGYEGAVVVSVAVQ